MRGISSFHLMRKAKTTRKDERETKRGKHEKADKNTGKVKAAIHRGEGAAWRAEGVFFFSLLSQEYKSGKVGVEEGHVDIPCNNMKDLPTYLHRLIPLLPPVLLHHQPHELDY